MENDDEMDVGIVLIVIDADNAVVAAVFAEEIYKMAKEVDAIM